MTPDNTAHANACCLNRWTCTAQHNGATRDELAMPCGFELCATVEGCPKAWRLGDWPTQARETLPAPDPVAAAGPGPTASRTGTDRSAPEPITTAHDALARAATRKGGRP